MGTSRSSLLTRALGTGAIVLAVLILAGCGFGSSDSGSIPAPPPNAGWVTLDYAWADSQNAYVGGTAFISPTGWSCCTNTAQDTGVTVVWGNLTTSASGSALQYVGYACFFSTCWPSTNTWSATIPLSGSNSLKIMASDSYGNHAEVSQAMAPGTIFPSVITTTPLKGASNVSVNTQISASFNGAMDFASFDTTTFQMRGNDYIQVAGTLSISGDGKTVMYTPASQLSPNSFYFVQIAMSVMNSQGNAMFHDYDWSFRTGALPDTSAPSVTLVVPTSNATDVSAAATAKARFSEAMDPATLDTSTFLLKDGANNPVSGSVSYYDNTARFVPASLLDSSTTYTATITTGATDTTGNGLASDSSWSFTTGTLQQGALDAAFATGGVASVNQNVSTAIYGLATDGTWLYAAGYSNAQGRVEKRALNNGALDPSFGTSGVIDTLWNTAVYAIAVDANYMYLAERDGSASPTYRWRIEKRYLSNGALVTTFGSNGVVTTAQSNYPFTDPKRIAIDTDYLYVAGFVATPSTKQWRIEKRRLSDGSLVTNFGSGGVITTAQSNTYPVGDVALAIDPTSLYIAGQSSNWGRIEKRNLTDGSLDPSFGTDGTVASNPYDSYHSITIDGTYLYAAASTWIEKRRLDNGALDTSFGANGILDTNSGTNLYAATLAIDAAYLYVGGIDYFGTWEWCIEKRDLSNGAFVSAFGTAGAVTSQPSNVASSNSPALNSILVYGNYLYAGGFGFIPAPPTDTWQWRIEMRYR